MSLPVDIGVVHVHQTKEAVDCRVGWRLTVDLNAFDN